MASIMTSLQLAFEIMALGMVLVFVFLSLLIYGIKLVSYKYAPHTEQSIISDNNAEKYQDNISIEPKKVAVITAALHQYRSLIR